MGQQQNRDESVRYWRADKLAPTLMVGGARTGSGQRIVQLGNVDRPFDLTLEEAREIGHALIEAGAECDSCGELPTTYSPEHFAHFCDACAKREQGPRCPDCQVGPELPKDEECPYCRERAEAQRRDAEMYGAAFEDGRSAAFDEMGRP